MPRSRKQGSINKGVLQGSQKDLFGNEVHVLNAKEVYRMVKCGVCKRTVKSSEAKTHLSYGNTLTICKECLESEEKERKSSRIANINAQQMMNAADITAYTRDVPLVATIN